MSADHFPACYALTLVYEGGEVNDPRDPGGATMCGITQQVYDEDREARGLPLQPVRLSTEAERCSIYRRRYWQPAGCEALPAGVDYALYDFAVNSGVGRAVKTLQAVVLAEPDGVMGRDTLAAALRYAEQYAATALVDAMCQARLQFLRGLPGFGWAGAGWTARVMGHQMGAQVHDTGVIDRAYAMASGQSVAAPYAPIPTPKTYLARAA